MDHGDLASYRAMSPGERLQLAFDVSAWFWRWLDVPDRAAGDRKIAARQREHDLSNETMLLELVRRDREPEAK